MLVAGQVCQWDLGAPRSLKLSTISGFAGTDPPITGGCHNRNCTAMQQAPQPMHPPGTVSWQSEYCAQAVLPYGDVAQWRASRLARPARSIAGRP